MRVTEEADGWVAGCPDCGRETWHTTRGAAEKDAAAHGKKHPTLLDELSEETA